MTAPTLYTELRAMLLKQGAGLPVAKDEPGALVIRTHDKDPKTGEAGWFAMLSEKKGKTVLHIMPLYNNDALEKTVAPCLAARRHGKTCFNFTKRDDDQIAAITKLATAAAKTLKR